MAQLAFPRAQLWGDVAAVGRSDAAYARRFFATHADRGSVIGSPGTELVWAGGRLLDAWPASPDENEYTHVQDSKVQTLLIGGKLDFATPPQKATRELLPHLPNGHQVVLDNLGHTDRLLVQPAGGEQASGQHVPGQRPRRHVPLHAESRRLHALHQPHGDREDHRRRRAGAGGAHGAVAAVDAAARASRCLRTEGQRRPALLYAPLLGLGGWLLAALIVLTALPTVPLIDELLVPLSVGLPVGLGIYFAWVHPDWSVQTKATGFATAVSGALVGAWLGFNVLEGFLALLTAMVGATRRREPDRPGPRRRLGSAGARSPRRGPRQGDPASAALDGLRSTRRLLLE